MREVTEFPHRVRVIENAWIPMSDGTRLAAKLWLPADAEEAPVPAILEYIPYRKRDNEAVHDSIMHGYFAGHGYAGVRVDLRGSGESEGVLRDEYLPQELADGLDVLRWIAAQPWCDGKVGMIGISWGGFNGLQIAALRPPELGAVITLCSTDDRYADDIHHMGGCLLGDNLSWASTMFARSSLPPDPALVGERWRDMWMERLEGSGLWLEKWLRHQRRDDYWKHGSVCEDYEALQVPVYAVSGWADGYSNAVFRMLAHLKVPRKGLVGPWSHRYPHLGVPGPAIGFLQEALRWWDHWLKCIDTGIMDEPMLRVWMQDSVPPTTSYAHRPGRWVAEREWPSPLIRERPLRLMSGRLVADDAAPECGGEEVPLDIQSPLTLGLFAGKWCSYAAGPDLAHDQRQEDGGALVFETEPLGEALEICGAPVLDLELEADQPVAMVAARLSDVASDGKATRVTYGLLNLTHRESSEHPAPLVPGQRYRVTVRLNEIAQRFPAGHRVRLALSTSYWPLAWPPPKPVFLRVHAGKSRLILPERPERDEDGRLPEFGEPEGAAPLEKVQIEAGHRNWLVHRDLASDVSTLEVINDLGTFRLPHADLVHRIKGVERYSSRDDEFDSLRGETVWDHAIWRDDWAISMRTHTVLSSTASHFHIQATLDAYEGDKRVYCRNWDVSIPRDCA
ncbi:CocE/NonD family hydrolase [Ferruginivarius sediminum]|uniref:CocE/NonD family hydrolase n=1 Tax=Ferruginivarius sediminum TaxID=2661937 RepID=A0A369TC15_9PROT|nr:CocE/NonD family hydrolase [Ferruginivarius sediminum]RDD61945.1 CocE/NonD family hydrolase [Ferruginivarius sediminum]